MGLDGLNQLSGSGPWTSPSVQPLSLTLSNGKPLVLSMGGWVVYRLLLLLSSFGSDNGLPGSALPSGLDLASLSSLLSQSSMGSLWLLNDHCLLLDWLLLSAMDRGQRSFFLSGLAFPPGLDPHSLSDSGQRSFFLWTRSRSFDGRSVATLSMVHGYIHSGERALKNGTLAAATSWCMPSFESGTPN